MLIRFLISKFSLSNYSEDFRRSFRNAIYSTADYLLLPILWFITTPIFISRLGMDQYGIWLLVNTFLGFSSVIGFGLSDATIKYVSKYRALGNKAAVIRVIRSTLTMYGILGILVGISTFLAAPFLVYHIFNVKSENLEVAIIALRIGGLGIIIRFFDSVLQSAIYGYERYDLATRVTILTNTATMIINVVLVLNGYGLIEILLVTVILLGVGGVAKMFIVKHVLIPNFVFTPLFDRFAFREIFDFGFYSWLHSISGIFLHQVDRFLIASLLNMSALTYYVVCLQVAQQIHAVLSRAVSFLFPLSSAVKETGNLQRLRRIYFKGLNFTTITAVAMGLPLFVFSHNVLSIWIGTMFANEAANILRILVLFFTLLATSIVPYYYLNGTGFVRLNALAGIIDGVIVVVVASFLIPQMGVAGASWAKLANVPIQIILRTIIHYKVLADYRWFAALGIFIPVIATFIIGFGVITIWGEPTLSFKLLIIMVLIYALLGASITGVLCYLFNYPKRILF
ncbi:MAG: oligosaccharide flippase family protein [Nitrososphaeria archaeon]